jgi:hypothetical protein
MDALAKKFHECAQVEAWTVQQVRDLSGERLATTPVRNPACREATNYMMPGGRRAFIFLNLEFIWFAIFFEVFEPKK